MPLLRQLRPRSWQRRHDTAKTGTDDSSCRSHSQLPAGSEHVEADCRIGGNTSLTSTLSVGDYIPSGAGAGPLGSVPPAGRLEPHDGAAARRQRLLRPAEAGRDWEYNCRVEQIRQLTLHPEEKEVLQALYDAGSGRDRALMATLDPSSTELSKLFTGLNRKGLIRQHTNRATLTRTGHVLFTLEKI